MPAEGRRHARPEQALGHREDQHENGARAGPDADREHHGHDLPPGERPGKLPRVDDVVARLARRMVMAVIVMVMVVMVMIVMAMIMIMGVGSGHARDRDCRALPAWCRWLERGRASCATSRRS